MARIDNINNFLTDVADSIRTKTGKSNKISASSFDTEIASITTSEDLDAELATYNTELTEQEESLSGIVEYLENKIESGEPLLLQDKSIEITENGTTNVTADEGYDGLNSVEVTTNVTSSGSKYTPVFISFYEYDSVLDEETLDIDTSKITSMDNMFYNCVSLTELDLSGWDTSNVQSIRNMFYSDRQLKKLNLSNWNTSKMTAMYQTFYMCNSLTELDLSGWDTSNVTTMASMFYSCGALKKLDIRNFDFSKVAYHSRIFDNVPVGCEIIVKDDTAKSWVLDKRSALTNVKTVAELEG